MKKKILIIGAGIAGHIAYNALREHEVTIIDSRSEPEENTPFHDAVMRFRDPNVAMSIGVDAKQITVRKEIYHKGQLYSSPNILFNNLYSLKLYGEIGRRSLNKLGDEERWISTHGGLPKIPGTLWNTKYIGVDKISCMTSLLGMEGKKEEHYDYCISTIPMPYLVSKVGVPDHISALLLSSSSQYFKYKPVKVITVPLPFKSTVHQTVYFPGEEYGGLYRATIEENKAKFEFIEPMNHKSPLSYYSEISMSALSSVFGIGLPNTSQVSSSTIQIGKIISIPENTRLSYILWLTDTYKILSFGRNAVWKPLRTDDLIGDIEKIKRMLMVSDMESAYRLKLS